LSGSVVGERITTTASTITALGNDGTSALSSVESAAVRSTVGVSGTNIGDEGLSGDEGSRRREEGDVGDEEEASEDHDRKMKECRGGLCS